MSLADDLGGASKLTTSQAAMIRQLATVIIESEKLQAQSITGETAVDHEQLVRLSNLQARLIGQLGLRQRKADDTVPTLADLLARREAV